MHSENVTHKIKENKINSTNEKAIKTYQNFSTHWLKNFEIKTQLLKSFFGDPCRIIRYRHYGHYAYTAKEVKLVYEAYDCEDFILDHTFFLGEKWPTISLVPMAYDTLRPQSGPDDN